MKNIYKTIILTLVSIFMYTSCDLEENPPFLLTDDIYSSVEGADTALNGILSEFASFDYYAANFQHTTLYMSGMIVPKKPIDIATIGILSPSPSQNYPTNLWRGMYIAISRANDLIGNVNEGDDPEMDNILGLAYFLRAHTYFNLVRIYGGVPLHTEPTTRENIHKPRASVEEVYNLIISDAKKAEQLMLDAGQQTGGRPGKLAANMLLAKVYMTLAGNDNGSEYWQKAYDEAIQVYGQYSLVSNYDDLWSSISTANNNSESIFEIQFNKEHSSAMIKLFTPNNAFKGKGWERFRANPEIIDNHMARYPDDPRINFTFISKYKKSNNKTAKVYPSDPKRKNFKTAYPYIYKFFIKDNTATTDKSNYNYVLYRYADLLLMLAEIENELGMSAEAHAHVNEVLKRARESSEGAVEPADWEGLSQDEFREAIMKEYTYELFAEGQDFFNARRRGYDWFKSHVIDVHNARNNKNFDLVYPDNPKGMLLPIPTVEIDTNEKLTAADQNPGY